MAGYDHLPTYKAAMDLTVYVETVVRNFRRMGLVNDFNFRSW